MVQPTRRQVIRGLAGTAGAAAGLGALAAPGTAYAAQGAAGEGAVIERDVVVIGGGSSGTYTAVRLTDLGKSVLLVEKTDRLGGHTQTYTDPATGLTTDIGVVVFHDLPIVHDYFGRFGIPLAQVVEGGGAAPAYADFRTGEIVPGYSAPVPTALEAYLGLLEQYPYLAAGYDLPDPVPAALLEPWGTFVADNDLGSLVQLVGDYAQGFAYLLETPAVYVLKYFGLEVVQGIATGDFLSTPNHDNSALYEAATTYLGDDVLLNTTVVAGERSGDGVELLAVGPQGPVTIRAGKIVITVPPLPQLLSAFSLDATELGLFSRFRQGNYWTGLLRLPGVPDATSVSNIGADTPYNLAPLPALYAVSPSSIPGLFDVKFGSDVPLPDAVVREQILESLGRLQSAGTLPPTSPVFVDFSSHSPYELTVSAADIAGGFYDRLYGLQGHRSTYWNGATFQAHDSTLLWQYAETLLPQIAS